MKLITKINLNFISLASFVLFAGCVLFYVLLRKITVANIDDELLTYQEVCIREFNQLVEFPERFVYFDVLIKIDGAAQKHKTSFADTTLVVNQQSKHFRCLEFNYIKDKQNYHVAIFKSLKHTDELVVQLLFSLCLLIIGLLISFYFLNKYVAIRSLDDFFISIENIRNFKVGQHNRLQLPQTDVDEFEQLNQVMEDMTKQIQQDFLNLKEFTENASHEIQTPLAIISTKLEQLFQDSSLSEAQLISLASIQEAVNRLSKLNKGLLLLTRIENKQFPKQGQIALQPAIQNQLENLAELIDDMELKVSCAIRDDFTLYMNNYLCELLIFNLIKNSIKHNIFNGSLNVVLKGNRLQLENTGENQVLEVEKLFRRFVKGNKSKSLGLGLAIVKKICDLYGISIQYQYVDKKHCISLSFPDELLQKQGPNP